MKPLKKTARTETLMDICYMAGLMKYYSQDSRDDTDTFVLWANEFNAAWIQTDSNDYREDVEAFTINKINSCPNKVSP